jgi:hypothetical protein
MTVNGNCCINFNCCCPSFVPLVGQAISLPIRRDFFGKFSPIYEDKKRIQAPRGNISTTFFGAQAPNDLCPLP